MFYYQIWVRSNRYHSDELLTYCHNHQLKVGRIVEIELQRTSVLGFVTSEVQKPSFKVKPLIKVYDLPPIPATSIKLAEWLRTYYPAPIGIIGQQFLPPKLTVKAVEQFSVAKPQKILSPALTDEQKSALTKMSEPNTYLLHGITGSGKTRIYVEMAIKQILDGQSAVILSPEIGLSTQLERSFLEVFANRVVMVHSKQTPAERQAAWTRCLVSEEPLIIIGPRSALFSPLKNIGLIVIDEFHDSSYKQEQQPRYHTVRVASALAEISKATLILGSATPSVADYFLAQSLHKPVLELKHLAMGNQTAIPPVTVVDIKERSDFSRSEWLSTKLLESMAESLKNGEQSLLFLNRRGTLRLIVCQNCGWEAVCPNCNLPLTYHGDVHELRCHSCGYRQTDIPSICPACKSSDLVYTTAGTKAIVDEVQRLFPNAKIRRYDSDNKKAEALNIGFSDILEGNVDILIGTQQITKGLDLPKLSTVGILQADTNLYLPDFSSKERSFQLITQVLGRINRGHVKGRAIIQTHSSNSPLWQAAISQDYKRFYESEIKERQSFKFPPFVHLLKLIVRRSSAKSAQQAGENLKAILAAKPFIQVDGPAPAFHEKSLGKYQWQLVVKSTRRSVLISIIKELPSGWTYDIDPINLL